MKNMYYRLDNDCNTCLQSVFYHPDEGPVSPAVLTQGSRLRGDVAYVVDRLEFEFDRV